MNWMEAWEQKLAALVSKDIGGRWERPSMNISKWEKKCQEYISIRRGNDVR